jgi:membrane protein
MKYFIKILKVLVRSFISLINHDGIEHAGYLSFLVLFSIFPFIIFFLVFASLLGFSEIGISFIKSMINGIPGDVFQSRIHELLKVPPQSLMTLAIFGSIWTASSFVEGLRTILNRIYDLSVPPSYIFRRMLSILQFFIISIFLFFGMMILVVIPIVLNKVPELNSVLSQLGTFWQYMRYILIFVCLFLSNSALYYIIPNVKIRFKQVLPGSFLTVCLWLISGYLLSNYIRYYSQLSFVYGSLGNIIITMIFFYIVNIIFIYGAEFNREMQTSDK